MQELKIEARTENLSQVLAFVDEQLESHDCPMKEQVQIDIAVEEMFVNIAHYAYAPEVGEALIQIGFADGCVSITFSDSGKPFDPLAKPDPDITLSAEERQIGGLGIYMVKKSMDNMTYAYQDGCNVVTIVKRLVA